MRRHLVLGVAAAVILSAAPAIASDHDHVDTYERGIKVGPLGQCFGCGRGYYRGFGGFAYAPTYRYYRHHRHYRGVY